MRGGSLPHQEGRAMPLKNNEIVANRYQILSCIGEGAMGVVYKAEHVLMKKIVAIKILHAQVSQQKEIVARFQREAQAASSIDHPNICAVTEFDYTAEGDFFLVMEYLEGETLHDRINRLGALSPMQSLSIAVQALSALQKAHELGIVHRDIKPENIFLVQRNDDAAFVKLLDFGIAHNTAFDGEQRLTQTGMIYGTPQYLSPEQATGTEVGLKSDLYSIGIILYEMLCGKPPFEAENLIALLQKHISEKPPLLKKGGAQFNLTHRFDAIIQKLLKKSPQDRYKSAADVVSDLLLVADELAEPIPPAMLLAKILVDKQSVDTLTGVNAATGSLRSNQTPPVTLIIAKIRRSRFRSIINVGIVILVLCIAGLVVYYYLQKPSAPKIAKLSHATLYPQNSDANLATAASSQNIHFDTGYAISHDESLILSRNIIAASEYLYLGKWAEACDALNSEYEIFHQNPNYLKLLAISLYKSGEWQKSFVQLQDLFNLNAEAAKDRYIGEILVDALNEDDTKKDAEDLIKNNPGPWISEGLALNIIGGDITKNNKFRLKIVDLIEEMDARQALPQWLQLAVELRLNDTTACTKREEIITKLLEINDPKAWVAIEPFSRVGKRGCTTKLGLPRDCQDCIRGLIKEARKKFVPHENTEENED